jgi:hypothetical protein
MGKPVVWNEYRRRKRWPDAGMNRRAGDIRLAQGRHVLLEKRTPCPVFAIVNEGRRLRTTALALKGSRQENAGGARGWAAKETDGAWISSRAKTLTREKFNGA